MKPNLFVTLAYSVLMAFGVAPFVPADEVTVAEKPITEADRQFWAFRPLRDPPIPEVADATWPRNAIDHFVLARLEDAGLAPAPAADLATLIRRVTFDLTGLPPTPDDVDSFLADDRPNAFERLIERLLASRAYGERWAQHWLDLARFAESEGFEHDYVRPDAWKYRDWVIQALNDDMPYDQFVRWQIAGDLLRPGDADAAVATGFALCGPDMSDINLLEERRHMVLNEMTATVGSVFLGLQIGCAECHDHKYDPISQADFYRLRAYFEPALQFEKQEFGRVLHEPPESEPVPSHVFVRGDFRSRGARVEPRVPRIAVFGNRSSHDNFQPDLNAATKSRVELARWLTNADNFLSTRVIVNRLWQHHFGRGIVPTPSDFGRMGQQPSHPQLLDWLAGELSHGGWSLKHLHRMMLASATYRQASRPDDPLVSHRANPNPVEVQYAAQRAWRRAADLDPENRLLWRANRRRLDGEEIRDALLMVANRLSPRTGGRGVMPPLPEELVVTLLKNQWKVSQDKEDHRRRSIYLFVRRNLRYPMFEVFDRPDTNASCARRPRSTIAPQALMLLNSDFSLTCARELSAYMRRQTGDNPALQVESAYRRTLGRHPTTGERRRAEAFLAKRGQGQQAASEVAVAVDDASNVEELAGDTNSCHADALTYLCLALFNLNEFVYLD